MVYPNEFKASCKKEFPDCKGLHLCLDRGDSRVGMYLSELTKKAISSSMVNPNPETVRMASQGLVLYNSWRELVR